MEMLDQEEKTKTRLKFKFIIVLFILGICGLQIGTLFKIQSWYGAGMIYTFGSLVITLSLLLLMIKVLRYKDPESILNK